MIRHRQQLQALYAELKTLRDEVCVEGADLFETWRPAIRRRTFVMCGYNLAMYLALRRRDLRDLQLRLSRWGLSSLGRSESRVLPNLDSILALLQGLLREDGEAYPVFPREHRVLRGRRMLRHNTIEIFGPTPLPRSTYIMVTLPSQAATDYDFMRDLVARGMNCIRINCAHDTSEDWAAMIANLRRAEIELDRRCKVLMDIGGPKPRTGVVKMPDKARLKIGDTLLLTRDEPQENDAYPYQASCTLPEIFDQLTLGASVWIDDGKIGSQVEALGPEGAVLKITHARFKGERLKADKGLNFPDTDLHLNPLTDKDLTDLDFVARNADMIGYSFVQSAEDIALLQRELARRVERPHTIAIIAKVETRRAVENLPDIIVRAGSVQPLGVMIARGDLAVELGYERMAEVQEELLWMCEAAHVPVVWATQVLEAFVKKGTPSRSEMTDAAMAVRAECVMLNKGDYVADAVTTLDGLLTRMRAHQSKKSPKLRALQSWAEFIRPAHPTVESEYEPS